jgi:PadR family transcriptional regulator, regulatory protein PadR
MQRNRPPSPETRRVLAVLAAAGLEWVHGYTILKATGLKSGSLYPILMRLEAQGHLEAEWQAPERPGRPPRHAYRLTAQGRTFVAGLPDPAPQAAPSLPAGAVPADGGAV